MPWTPPPRKFLAARYIPDRIDRKLLGRAIYLTLKAENKPARLRQIVKEAETNSLYCRAALSCQEIMKTYKSL